MNQEIELKLQALLDGELPAGEAAEIRRLIAADPEAALLFQELEFSRAALRQNEQPVAVPETREFYWSKIERQILRESSRLVPAPLPLSTLLRRIFASLAGVAALVAVLLITLKQSTPQMAMDEVSTTDGLEARTIRDQSAGMTIVFLQDTRKPQNAASQPKLVRTRDDGSSFNIDLE